MRLTTGIFGSNHHVALGALLALTAGCGVFGGDAAPVPATTGEGAPVAPVGEPALPPGAPPPISGPPAADEVTEAFGVFVAPAGSDGNPGTRVSPFATLTAAIEAAAPQAKRVYVCAGSYVESVDIANAVSVIGGYDCADATAWKRTAGVRSRILAPTSPALRAQNIESTTRFEGFEVKAPDATTLGSSSIGLRATNAGKLTLADVLLAAGKGADGAPGATPDAPAEGGGGSPGAAGQNNYGTPPGDLPIWPYPAAAAGGTSTCGGGPGGVGGRGGVWVCEFKAASGNVLVLATRNTFVTIGAPVEPGTVVSSVGAAGTDGASATAPGALTVDGFVPAGGTKGANGGPGSGGSGGPAESADGKSCSLGKYSTLANGSGGGAGGCGGVAGEPGSGGGASIGAFVVASDGLTFMDTTVTASAGGQGGAGTFGAPESDGGASSGPRAGLPGLPGGRAGVGGSGAGGSSFGVAHRGAPPLLKGTSKVLAGKPGVGVSIETRASNTIRGGTATIPASAAGDAKDVARF
jgi:hypothetical protein